MITPHANDKVSSNADVESATEGYVGTDADSTGEDTHFLSTDTVLDFIPGKSTQRYVILMCVQFLFMIAFSQFIMDPPLQEIMEDFICHSQYPDHLTGVPNDSRCKNPDVQGTLAMVRSWLMWVGMLVSLVVQIPYGIIADKYGRRPVLFFGLLGIVLANAWFMIVLLQPDVFSIWHLLFAPIPTLMGGGEPVITAMVWTILSDSIPTAKRTSLFYRLHAMMLILSAIFRPVAAWLLSINPWLPMWLGLGTLVLSMFSTLLVPETLHLSKISEANEQPEDKKLSQLQQGVLKMAWSTARRDFSKSWHTISGSKSIVLLILGYGLCFPITITFEMNMLQYVTKRFNWDWSEATYFTTISKASSVIVLLVFLPLISLLVTKRFRFDALTRDLYLSRGSLFFITAGNVLTSIAAAPWLLITSLIVLSFGNGFQPQIRAMLAGVVEHDTLATLNTAIATVETLMGLVSVPALGWLLSKGIELGGAWMGLPFVMTSFCAVLATLTMFAFRIPQGMAYSGGGYELLSIPKE